MKRKNQNPAGCSQVLTAYSEMKPTRGHAACHVLTSSDDTYASPNMSRHSSSVSLHVLFTDFSSDSNGCL